jgi:hypothetical protein
LASDVLDTKDEKGSSASSEGKCGRRKVAVGKKSTVCLMSETSEVETEAWGRGLHES